MKIKEVFQNVYKKHKFLWKEWKKKRDYYKSINTRKESSYQEERKSSYYELFGQRKSWYYEFLKVKVDLFKCRKLVRRLSFLSIDETCIIF